jgi:hypothetical protein
VEVTVIVIGVVVVAFNVTVLVVPWEARTMRDPVAVRTVIGSVAGGLVGTGEVVAVKFNVTVLVDPWDATTTTELVAVRTVYNPMEGLVILVLVAGGDVVVRFKRTVLVVPWDAKTIADPVAVRTVKGSTEPEDVDFAVLGELEKPILLSMASFFDFACLRSFVLSSFA